VTDHDGCQVTHARTRPLTPYQKARQSQSRIDDCASASPERHCWLDGNLQLEGDPPGRNPKQYPSTIWVPICRFFCLKSGIDRMRNCCSLAGPEHDQDSLRNMCRFGHRFYIGSKRFKLVRLGLAKKEYVCFAGQHPEIRLHHLSTVLYIVGDCAQSKVT
jgi:hypothetical protein